MNNYRKEYDVEYGEQNVVSVVFTFDYNAPREWADKCISDELQGMYEAGYRKIYEDTVYCLEDEDYESFYEIEVELVKDVEART
jgi:hypothetical protein